MKAGGQAVKGGTSVAGGERKCPAEGMNVTLLCCRACVKWPAQTRKGEEGRGFKSGRGGVQAGGGGVE